MDIHRCRFVDYVPHTITALAFSHASNTARVAVPGLRLAVGRANGDIEIWNPRYNWLHELTLPGARGRAVEGLVWAHAEGELPRLFSIGLSTYITEWDLATGRPRANINCNAGVVWCIDANASGTRLAAGCDDGSVVIIDISGGPGVMEYLFICQRQDLRVLGLRWYDDAVLVGGCADGKVRCWDTADRGAIVSSMKVDKLRTELTLVWSVVCLPARGQFVTGDSTGSVKFWDMATHTMVQSFSTHDADVLTLARDAAGDKVFSAGIDRKIHQFLCLESKRAARWVHNFNRLLHLNDVRTLACFQSKAHSYLVLGGVERSLIVQSVDNFHQGPYKKILMDQQVSNITACARARIVALYQDQTVKVWRLHDRHKLVAKLLLAEDDNITSVSIGDFVDGVALLAVATINSVKLFSLAEDGAKVSVAKIRDPAFDLVISGAKHVAVYAQKHLLVHTPDDELYRFVVGETVELEDELESLAEPRKGPIEHHNSVRCLVVSEDSTQVAVARFNNTVEILPLSGKGKARVLSTLTNSVHLMAFTNNGTLAVLTDENKLFEFNITDTSTLLTAWSQKNSECLPAQFLRLDLKPAGMFVQDKRVWVFGSQWLAFVDLSVDVVAKSNKKKRSRDGASSSGDDGEADEPATDRILYWITQKYRPLLRVEPWGQNEILVVEREAFALPTAAAFEAPKLRV